MLEGGLDLRYGLSNRFTADLTLNTDFAQVEADDEQINLDRFSLFVPEKRRFFLERGSLFEFPLDGFNRLFHSRRVGIGPSGEGVRILGGGRVVGAAGGWQVGGLSLQTAEADGAPGENLSVLRARRPILNRNSMAGAMVTTRIPEGGTANVAYGLDAVMNLTGDEYLSLRWAHSLEDGVERAPLRAGHLDAHWERRGQEGWGYRFRVTHSGEDFRPGVGFMERRGYRRFGDHIHYDHLPESGSFQRHRVGIRGSVVTRHPDGGTESGSVGVEWEGARRDASSFRLTLARQVEDVLEPFTVAGEVLIPSGRHTFGTMRLAHTSRSGRSWRVSGAGFLGGFFHGNRSGASLAPSWNLSRHLELSGRYEVNRITVPGSSTPLVTHLAQLRVLAARNVHLSGSGFLQYNSVNDRVSANLRLRYHFRDGTDLHLVLNETTALIPGMESGPRHRDRGRTLALKYTHTLSW